MIRIAKKIAEKTASFLCEQYIVLFFTLTTSIKLIAFNTYILKVTWDPFVYHYGLFLSAVSAVVIFLPIYFIKKRKNLAAILLASFISILLLVDCVYFLYFSALPSVGLLGAVNEAANVGPAILGILRWWMVFFFVDVIIITILNKSLKRLFNSIKYKYDLAILKLKSKLLFTATVLVLAFLSLLPIGLNTMSDMIEKSFEAKSTSMHYGVLASHVFDIIRFIKQETTHLSTSDQEALKTWVTENKPDQSISSLNGIAKGKNIIMIQVESLGAFVINQTVNNKEITPTLNSLSKSSEFFPNEQFIIGAGHTSDTDFVANTSYFPLDDSAIFVRFGKDSFDGLPTLLAANGYSTTAYHGYSRDSWNRNIALASLGYQKFYASDNFSAGENINMGLNDGTFFSETADYIKGQTTPSFSYVITLTSHTPFDITTETSKLGLNPNDYPSQVAGYLENINYTDRMLGNFFTKLKSENLYDDSLIIVYGDHTPTLSNFTAGTITYDLSTNQAKEAPLFIKLPNQTIGTTYKDKGTHLDIMPTILDLAGIKNNHLMFGQSLFADNTGLAACDNQLFTFVKAPTCQDALAIEKSKSATIVRYDQFNNL